MLSLIAEEFGIVVSENAQTNNQIHFNNLAGPGQKA